MFVGLAFSPDSRILAMADCRSRCVRLWDVEEAAERPPLPGAEGAVLAVAISPDGGTIAAADYQGSVHTWRLDTGRLDPTSLVHSGVQTLAFAPDGRTLATGGFDGTVHLWDWPRPADEGD
jgi:WD40 repeat protein